jgi:hypothetical protein
MPIYPKYNSNRIPKKNVLVISCIDLRLTDDTVKFLHHDNLTNRFDHFILAGASLCTCVADSKVNARARSRFDQEKLKKNEDFNHWRKSLKDHIKIAVDLHHIKDVYIIEHTNCGAYKVFLNKKYSNPKVEVAQHKYFANILAEEIHTERHEELHLNKEGKPVQISKGKYQMDTYHLNVNCFLINLRGDVEHFASYQK